MNEKQIQYAIYRRCAIIDKSHVALVPNCYTLLENECDVFGVRKSLLTDEFEIKVSRSDFMVDAKKKVRFKINGKYTEFMLKSEAYIKGLMPTNYFWYVTPRNLLDISDIPTYAGLMEVSENGIILTRKQAPKLSKTKMEQKDIIKHVSKLTHKFWKLGVASETNQ